MCTNIHKYKIYVCVYVCVCVYIHMQNFTTYTVPYYHKETEKDTEFL